MYSLPLAVFTVSPPLASWVTAPGGNGFWFMPRIVARAEFICWIVLGSAVFVVIAARGVWALDVPGDVVEADAGCGTGADRGVYVVAPFSALTAGLSEGASGVEADPARDVEDIGAYVVARLGPGAGGVVLVLGVRGVPGGREGELAGEFTGRGVTVLAGGV